MTIRWNEVTIWWNEVTKGWHEVAWNEVVMERSDRNSSINTNLKHVLQDCKLGISQERGSLTLSQFMKLISQKKL